MTNGMKLFWALMGWLQGLLMAGVRGLEDDDLGKLLSQSLNDRPPPFNRPDPSEESFGAAGAAEPASLGRHGLDIGRLAQETADLALQEFQPELIHEALFLGVVLLNLGGGRVVAQGDRREFGLEVLCL